jgi:predicted Zn-dependent protease
MRLKQIYLLPVVLLLAACVQASTRTPGIASHEIDTERNYQQQLVMQEKLRQQEVKSENRVKMLERLQRVYKPIGRAALDLCTDMQLQKEGQICIYEVVLEEEGPLNAYTDGNTIHVTPAMVSFADTDDELALVLAHETAHNLMRHVDGKMQNAIFGGLVGLLLDGVAASQGVNTQGEFTKIGMNAGVLSYSQDFEREADYIGMYLMARAKRNYHQAPDLWRRMSIRNPEAIYLSTSHPSNPERFVMMDKVAAEIDQKKTERLSLLPELRPQETAYTSQATPAYPSKRGSR